MRDQNIHPVSGTIIGDLRAHAKDVEISPTDKVLCLW